jgi:hypothetical protein
MYPAEDQDVTRRGELKVTKYSALLDDLEYRRWRSRLEGIDVHLQAGVLMSPDIVF